MRQLRPLLLPAIVAEKKASASSPSDDMARFPTSCESFHSTTTSSESSCPPTPTFSIRGHSRYPSSNSSLASSPQTHESILDAVNTSGKLPKLTEEPLERDEQDDEFVLLNRHNSIVSPCLCDDDDCPHQPHSVHGSTTWLPYGRPSVDDSFVDDADFPAEYEAARRQSGESSVSGIGIRFESRFSSFSRRLKNRKRTSGLSVKTQSIAPSFVSSRPASTSRSSSLTGSIIRPANAMERAPTTPVKSYFEIPNDSSPESAVEIVQSSLEPEPFDREMMVSTPLLPPTLMRLRDEDTPSQSPLQSPTVADSGCAFPFGISPTGTPRITATQTPPLSTKPSCSSLSASRSAFSIANADIPPLRPLDLDDKWSAKLGHANFTIYPQPYVPDVFDLSTCQQLFTDWEQARRNFMKHQVRTGEHFGVTSKAYKLSEQKWAEIDAQWKRYHEITLTKAGQHGNLTRAPSQIEPAPLVKLPSLTNKFPAKGDEDIVGLMTQVASPTQSPRSKKASFFKFFADLKISSSLLGKSSPGVRPQR